MHRDLHDKSPAFISGYGVGYSDVGDELSNPFPPGSAQHGEWLAGYDAGAADRCEEPE